MAVIMSVYNGELYLKQAIESILKQSYPDFKFYITDDGSRDKSWDILNEYNDSRIHLWRHKNNLGLTKTLNQMLNNIEENIIVRMDGDDISHSSRLEKIVGVFDSTSAAWVTTRVDLIDESGVHLKQTLESRTTQIYIDEYLSNYNFYCHGAMAFKRKSVQDLGGYNESLQFSQDYDLWLRMFDKYGQPVIIPETLYSVRRHHQNISRTKWKSQLRSRLEISNSYGSRHWFFTPWTKFVLLFFNSCTAGLTLSIERLFKRYLVLKSIITNKF